MFLERGLTSLSRVNPLVAGYQRHPDAMFFAARFRGTNWNWEVR
jgi:hypothetical protein